MYSLTQRMQNIIVSRYSGVGLVGKGQYCYQKCDSCLYMSY